nr:hypothetical protein [Alphaproteobacteria bacterium]
MNTHGLTVKRRTAGLVANTTATLRQALPAMRQTKRLVRYSNVIVFVALTVIACTQSALAIEKAPGEAKRLKACERSLCTMILLKKPAGKDLKCDLTK